MLIGRCMDLVPGWLVARAGLLCGAYIFIRLIDLIQTDNG